MGIFKRFAGEEARITTFLRAAIAGFWLEAALWPWILELGATRAAQLSTHIGLFAGAGFVLGRAGSSAPIGRWLSATALVLAPALGVWLAATPSPWNLALMAIALPCLGAATADRAWRPPPGAAVSHLIGVALGVGAAHLSPGPLLPLPWVGMLAGGVLAALAAPRAQEGAPPPGAALDSAWLAPVALGVAGVALQRYWITFMSDSRPSTGALGVGLALAVAAGQRLRGHAPGWLLGGAGALSLALLLNVGADAPLSLGLTGVMDTAAAPWIGLWLLIAAAGMWLLPGAALIGAAPQAPAGRLLLASVGGAGAGALLSVWVDSPSLLRLAALLAALAPLSAAQQAQGRARLARGAAALAGPLLLLGSPAWPAGMMASGVLVPLVGQEGVRRAISDAQRREVTAADVDPRGDAALLGRASRAAITVDGLVVSAGELTAADERFTAHLALLLHPAPSDVAVLGLGSGAALHAATLYPGISITAVAASPASLRVTQQAWEGALSPFDDPAITSLSGALRPTLRSLPPQDVVLIPAQPAWTTGGASLWTQQWFEAIAAGLRSGGIVAAQLPLQPLGREQLAQVLATFTRVFPSAVVWLPPSGTRSLTLIGVKDTPVRLSWLALTTAMSQGKVRQDLLTLGLTDPLTLLERALLGPSELQALTSPTAILTDARPRLDLELPTLALRSDVSHPLTLFQGHRSDVFSLVSDVEGSSRQSLEQGLQRSAEATQALIALLNNLGEGAYDEAVASVLKMGPRSDRDVLALTQPYLERARRDMGQGQLDKALSQLTMATVLAPRMAQPWILLAQAQRKKGDPQAALGSLREALEREPTNLLALTSLAELLQGEGRRAEAITALEQARSLAPTRTDIGHNLATLYLVTGRLEEARGLFEQVTLQDRSLARAHAGLAETHLRRGDEAAALLAAQEAVRLEPVAPHFDVLGQVLLALGDFNRARSALVQCLLRDPDATRCLGGMGIVYAEEGQIDKAAETWQRILTLEPDNRAAAANLERLKAGK